MTLAAGSGAVPHLKDEIEASRQAQNANCSNQHVLCGVDRREMDIPNPTDSKRPERTCVPGQKVVGTELSL